MRSKLLVALVLGAAAVLPAFTADAQALKPWRHGVINLKSDAGFVMMPMQHDFMAKHGLKIDVVQVKDGAIGLKALISGELESLDGGAGEGIVAALRGADVKTTGCHWPGLPHALFVRGNINKVEDLKGKSIATSAPGSLPDNMMRTILEKYGMSPNDVTFAAVGGDNDRYKALTAGIVDATIVSSEYLPISPPGIKILIAGRDVIPNFMRLCLNMSSKTIAARRDDAIGFLAGEIEGLRYAFAHRDETIALARKLSGAKPDDPRPAFVYGEFVKYKAVDPEIPLPMDKIAWMADQFVKNGTLPHAGDVNKIVDPTLRVKALELAGK
jgi:ABC-type nitrate/sulfonate/bicarbonate transport system substrate-binding protein